MIEFIHSAFFFEAVVQSVYFIDGSVERIWVACSLSSFLLLCQLLYARSRRLMNIRVLSKIPLLFRNLLFNFLYLGWLIYHMGVICAFRVTNSC